MTEQPLLVATSQGPLSAIVGLPDHKPRAGLVFMQGRQESRAGANQTWARITRAANAIGVATIRSDYAGIAESWDADPYDRLGGVRELLEAFDTQTGDVPLLVLAACYGLSPAAHLAREGRHFAAAAVVTPPLLGGDRKVKRPRNPWPRRVRNAPRRIAGRLRYGKLERNWVMQPEWDETFRTEDQLAELAAHCPTWILTGTHDGCTESLLERLPALQAKGDVSLDVVDGHELYRTSTPDAQAIVGERVHAWLQRCLAEIGAST